MTAQAPTEQGLSSEEAALRLQRDGPNGLTQGSIRRWRHILLETASEPMFALLLAAGLLYLVLGERQEGYVLLGMVGIILALTLYQEGKTERAIEALRDLSSPRARVVRDGKPQLIAGLHLVCGDILLLAEGERVAADAVLLSGTELRLDESLLTGESIPVAKRASGASEPGDTNQLFSGTLVVQGQGMARVCATGKNSAIGRIGSDLQMAVSAPSPLRRQTARLVRFLAWLTLGLSLFLVLAYGLIHSDWTQALLSGIALAMAMLPQEFTVVLTVLPALGAWRLSHQNVLTRRITAIETLGATSVLCVDKTGTLTQNRMSVVQLQTEASSIASNDSVPSELPEEFHGLVEFAILASDVDPFDPMEQAFHRLGEHYLKATEHLHTDWTLVHAYSLTPELRAMARVWQAVGSAQHVVAAKGSPEAILDLCHLPPERARAIALQVDAMAEKGLRVLAVAQARFEGPPWPAQEHDFDFEYLGLLGLADPLRDEIPKAVSECHKAGIRVIMITGDYPITAHAIAGQAGLKDGDLLTGEEMLRLTDLELQQRLRKANVCARIAPAQKLRIVQALKANGAVTAMTGDGVNDAPALKAAHVGVAMGARGTDVAREAAALVLLDDNFASIVGAVRLGRRIFDNLQKSMSYILAVHVPIAGMALLPVLIGWPIVLYPMHIAFLELVIDPACSMVFENEPEEQGVMQRPPRDVQAALFGGSELLLAVLQGTGVLAVVLAAYAWGAQQLSEPQARALAFTTLVVANLALIFSNRFRRGSFWASLKVPNRTLWIVCSLTLVLLLLALYVPDVSSLLHLAPLPLPILALAGALGLSSVLWFEVLKSRRRTS